MDSAHSKTSGNDGSIRPEVVSNPEINFFGLTNFRNQNRKFGIKLDDRRRHMYVVGKTGMGKTTLLENMVLNDIYSGHGIGLVDPHGDFAEKIINYIPTSRINDVVYFNPADIDYPIGFNILETIRPEQKHLVASGLMGVFKKIWPDVWSARMEYILNNTILALLDFPGTTLLGINRLLADEEYRKRVVNNVKDPVVKAFWTTEFANYTEKFRTEAVAPIQNKIGQFLSASVIRNIVAQVKSRINIREIMDNKKIFIMNLSKGRIGEDNSRLLGGMLVTRIQLAAMERVDILEKDRKDFFLYVDEFQNFATESFANILSEARKYRLGLIMAHQYMEQLEEEVMAAVIGNVGTMVTFRVGSTDAEILAKEFAPTFVEEDLVNLPKFHTYLKLMIDGVASRPFSALTLPPIGGPTGNEEKVIRVSRERYAVPREKIEDKIARWSGMIVGGEESSNLEIDDEDAMFQEAAKQITSGAPSAATQAPATMEAGDEPLDHDIEPNVVSSSLVEKTSQPSKLTVREVQMTEKTSVLERTPKGGPSRSTAPATPPTVISFGGSGRQGGQGGDGERRKKRKRKRGGRDRDSRDGRPPQGGGQPVVLGNPNERGMSLNNLRQQQPRQEQHPEPEQRREPQQSTPQPQPQPQPQPKPAESSPAPLDLGFVREEPSQPKPPQPSQNKAEPTPIPPGTVVHFDE